MSHTPGPWKVTEAPAPDSYIVRADAATAKPIASIWWNGDPPRENAHLIASAPRLLEAVERMLSDWDKSGQYQSETVKFCRNVVADVRPEK